MILHYVLCPVTWSHSVTGCQSVVLFEVQLGSHLGTPAKGFPEADFLQLLGRQFCRAYFILWTVFPHFISKLFGALKLQGRHSKTSGRRPVFQFQFRFADFSDKMWVIRKDSPALGTESSTLAAPNRQLPPSACKSRLWNHSGTFC